MTTNTDKVIKERTSIYGEFDDVANIAAFIRRCAISYLSDYDSDEFRSLYLVEEEAIHMIANKLGRALNGDITYLDNWDDIAGYSQLVISYLQGNRDDWVIKNYSSSECKIIEDLNWFVNNIIDYRGIYYRLEKFLAEQLDKRTDEVRFEVIGLIKMILASLVCVMQKGGHIGVLSAWLTIKTSAEKIAMFYREKEANND